MTNQKVAGVDWAKGEWLAVIFENGTYSECFLETDFEVLWKRVPEVNRMLIDVPIGLPDDEETLQNREELDSLARSVTGRPSSVFPVPSREACTKATDEEPYERVNETNQDVLGKGLSQQSYQIASGIGEVDAFLQSNASISTIVTESHPEVCFRGLRGEELRYSKKTAAGVGERLDSLDNHLDVPGDVFHTLCARLTERENRATVDDVIDAFGLAVTAWKSGNKPDTLPKNPNTDSKGLPMQMAYWSEDSLV